MTISIHGKLNRNFISAAIILLLCLTLGSCKSHKKVNEGSEPYFGETIDRGKHKGRDGNKIGQKIAEECIKWIGTPYGYGHSEKGVATDCSGMVVVVYEKIGKIKLPRNSAEQSEFSKSIKEKDVRAGDLVFFATGNDKKKVSHVGVMIDKNKFVHASGSKGVIISEMSTPYYQRTFIKFGRVL